MTTESWAAWARRLIRATRRAEATAPVATCPCHRGGPDPHTVRGRRAARLRAECRRQADAWYRASRRRGGGAAPEDHPDLARALDRAITGRRT